VPTPVCSPRSTGSSRRRFLSGLALLLLLGVRTVHAEELAVPIRTQVELLSKVVVYDRNFRSRAGNEAKIVILVREGNSESERNALLLEREIDDQSAFGGLPAKTERATYKNAEALAALVRERKPAVVSISTALSAEIPAIAKALSGSNVLTFAVNPTYVGPGSVVGFELEGSKPKLIVNLRQAKQQNVSFAPELLRLARVIQ
jgi:hypothetical protein